MRPHTERPRAYLARLGPGAWSIRLKSVLLAIAYLVALSAVYAAFSLYILQRQRSESHERLEQTARIVAAQFDAAVASGLQRLETVSRLPGLSYGLQTIQESTGAGYIPPWTTLHYLFYRSPPFTAGVFLLDRTGKVLWTEPAGLPWLGQVLTDVPPVGAMYQTPRAVVSGVVAPDRVLARPHVIIGVPIQNDSGDLQGILAGIIDLTGRDFVEILRPVSTNDGRYVEVVDQDGVVLAGTETAHLFQTAVPFTTSGETAMNASAPLTRAPWRVVAGQPPSFGLASVRKFQSALWGIGLALLLVAGAVVVPILNRFVNAIRQLTDAAATVARGDLSQPVPVSHRRDEIATLAHAFEQMRVELGRSRRILEQRLEEREQLIGKLMRAQEELHGAQARLIEAERFAAIGELSAAVAHGIRNPVAGIKTAAQCANFELAADHPLRENIRDIIHEADKLEARIKTLLDFARPFAPHLATCTIEQIIADAADSLRSQMAAQRIHLEVRLAPGLPSMELDRAQIEQVVLALLANAVEAMPDGGHLTVTGKLAKAGKVLALAVSDTGPGIPAEQLPRLFRLFYTTKSSGTGLGLAVTKKIVERHGGNVSVVSVPGEGATFLIELPLHDRPKAPVATAD